MLYLQGHSRMRYLLAAFFVSASLLISGCAGSGSSISTARKAANGVVEGDPNAMQTLRNLAEKGDVDAQFWLGKFYDEGQGVEQDYATAYRWYGKAAAGGDLVAQLSFVGTTNIKNRFAKLLSSRDFGSAEKFVRANLVDINNTESGSFINKAAAEGALPIVRLLVSMGANIKSSDCNPVYHAAQSGKQDVVEYLLANGASLEAKCFNSTPLQGVTRGSRVAVNDPQMASFLISKGADIKVKSEWGFTPLEILKNVTAMRKEDASSVGQWEAQQKAVQESSRRLEQSLEAVRADAASKSNGNKAYLDSVTESTDRKLKQMQTDDNARRNRDAKSACENKYGSNSDICR